MISTIYIKIVNLLNIKSTNIHNYQLLDMATNYQFLNNNISKPFIINTEPTTPSKNNITQINKPFNIPQSPKQSQYVFRAINPLENKIIDNAKIAKQNKEINKISNGISNTQQKAKQIDTQENTATNKKIAVLEKQAKIRPSDQTKLLNERLIILQNQKQTLLKQNISLKNQIKTLNQKLEQLSQEQKGKLIISLQQQNKQLQLQIEKIKDEYVQTSLDCFNEALKGQFQKIIELKGKLEDQKQKNQELTSLISQFKRKIQYYQKQIELKSKIFGVQVKSNKQKFQIKLSDKDNKIKELQHSLETLSQKYQVCLNQIKLKDNFLYQLKEERQRNP